MNFRFAVLLLLFPIVATADESKSRTFRFSYETTVTGLKPDETARIWLPIPQTTDDQEVTQTSSHFPVQAKIGTEAEYGNRMYYLEPSADRNGKISLRVSYTVRRKEVRGETNKSLMGDLSRFLKPDLLAPTDGKHNKLIEGKTLPMDPMAMAREFYDIVNGLMKYSKVGTEWGRGDVNWVCDNRFGNCTDFHSLFTALCRSQKMPALFEIGFGIPEKRGSGNVAGYHCWAKFRPANKGWVPVDISEANKNPKLTEYCFGNLSENRVTFTVGRAITLEPKQDGPPLNFFVYPYVEVGGKVYSADKIAHTFAYEDIVTK